MSRRSPFVLLAWAVCMAPLACTAPAAAPPPGRLAPGQSGPRFDAAPAPAAPTAAPAVAAAPAPAPAPAPAAAPGAGASSCDDARFVLDPGAVVATVDGKEVLARELGDQLAKAEASALRTYCDQVAQLRKQALDNAIDERLLDAAATKAGFAGGGNAWLQSEVAKLVKPPTDEEISAFYDANKTETAPPLDQVRDQVIAAMVEEPTQNALRGLLGELRKDVSIQASLPDVAAPPVDLRDDDATAGFGPRDAKVHVVEFSDFECPYCARAADAVNDLKQRYGDRVRFSYRHFPLSFHPNARPAAEMAQCAQAQDKFWPFHDAVFASASQLGAESLRGAAEKAGLDMDALDGCMKSGTAAKQVEADMRKAEEAGVSGTPNFFVNGRAFEGGPGQLAAAIEAELQRAG